MITEDRPKEGFFTRLLDGFKRHDEEEFDYYDDEEMAPSPARPTIHAVKSYRISIRKSVTDFEDAVLAADGLKRGEQQLINLSSCRPELREKIKDFLAGVNYTAEGSWQDLGENVYLLAPAAAQVEVETHTRHGLN